MCNQVSIHGLYGSSSRSLVPGSVLYLRDIISPHWAHCPAPLCWLLGGAFPFSMLRRFTQWVGSISRIPCSVGPLASLDPVNFWLCVTHNGTLKRVGKPAPGHAFPQPCPSRKIVFAPVLEDTPSEQIYEFVQLKISLGSNSETWVRRNRFENRFTVGVSARKTTLQQINPILSEL